MSSEASQEHRSFRNIEQQAGEHTTQIGQVYGSVTIHIHNLPKAPSALVFQPFSSTADEPIPKCPYRGLFAFRPEHAHLFFGRDSFTRQLVEATESRSAVAVLGASGSGKSSAVFAGLVPALDASGQWRFTYFRPGDDPFLGLASALVPLIGPELSKIKQVGEARDVATRLQEGRSLLTDYIKEIHKNVPDQRLLIIADQFEELYTLCRDNETRQRFLDVLLSLVEKNQTSSPCLVLNLRADFLSQASLYRRFADALQGATELIGPMTREELTRAIIKPANLQNVIFEDKLVERILDDVGQEEGSLPLLEFALNELWQHQRQRTLTHVAYEEIGEIKGALSRHADQAYQRLTPAEQKQARRIFVQLVNPGTGTEDTRRLARRAELETNWSLVAKLANERLVVTDQSEDFQDTVEVVHEALIRHWRQLQTWMDEDRTFRSWQERLRFAMGQWQIAQQDEGALLRGTPLAEAESWLTERETDLSQAEQVFIRASLDMRKQEATEREIQRRRIVWALGAIALLIIAFLTFGLWSAQRSAQQQLEAAQTAQALTKAEKIALSTAQAAANEVQRESKNVLAQSLAAQAPFTDDDNELTTLLAIEAIHLNSKWEGDAQWLIDRALREVLSKPNFNTILSRHRSWVSSLAFSPDGEMLASGSFDTDIMLWDLNNLAAPTRVLRSHRNVVYSMAFSPDGELLASSGDDKIIMLWDLTDLEVEPHVLRAHDSIVNTVAFSPDGEMLASSSSLDNTVRLWDLTDLEAEPRVLRGYGLRANTLALSPDGEMLASVGRADGRDTVLMWDLNNPEAEPHVLNTHGFSVTILAFSPDGEMLASGNFDGIIRLWDLNNPEVEPHVLDAHNLRVNSVAFSPDGETLASGSEDGTIRLWDLTDLEAEPRAMSSHDSSVSSIVFSPDGELLASGSNDKTIRLWNLNAPVAAPRVISSHNSKTNSVAFSPDSELLASSGDDKVIILWDLNNLEVEPRVLRGHEDWVNSVAFSPDGETLASGSNDNTVRLWDLTDLEAEPRVLRGHEDWVNSVAFSPDGQTLASGSADTTIMLWDLTDLEAEPRVLGGHEDWVSSVVFSPGGELLASSSDDLTIRLWDLNNLEAEPRVLRGHSSWVRSAAFSLNGEMLASSSVDKGIILWDLTDLEAEPRVLRGHEDWVNSVAFSPDGETLASGSNDKTIQLWLTSIEVLAELGCQQVHRNLTQTEWKRYLPNEDYHQTCSN